MNDWFSKCGANCRRCPAFRGNIRSDEDRQRCSDGWHRYLRVRLDPRRCYCDGCQTPDDQNPILVYSKHGCRIRQCAVFNGAPTCAHCSAYPCEAVRGQFSFDVDSRERLAARLGVLIPDEEYATFIEPYELHRHLAEIRATLGPDDIVEIRPVSVKPRISAFPDHMPCSMEEMAALRSLHRLLSVIGTAEGIPHVQRAAAREQRQHLLKLLWTFGLHGQPQDDGWPHLLIDAKTYLAQKIHSSFERLTDYLQILDEHGVKCRHVPVVEEGWLTPKGALRKEGWLLTLSFEEGTGGGTALQALQTYTTELEAAHGRQAFRRFSKADMQILG